MATQNHIPQAAERQEHHEPQFRFLAIPDFICDMVQAGTLDARDGYLLATIHSYNRKGQGCFASNAYLAKRCGFQKQWVQRRLATFITMGLLRREGGKGADQRYLFTTWEWSDNLSPPMSSQTPPHVQPDTHIRIEEKTKKATVARSARQRVAVRCEHDHWDISIARRIWSLTNKRGVRRQFRSDTWVPPISQLRKALNNDKERIECVLAWYEKHGRDHWYKLTHSKGFNKNFDHLEAGARASPSGTDDNLHEETETVLARTDQLIWPKGAGQKLSVAVSTALKSIDQLYEALDKVEFDPKTPRDKILKGLSKKIISEIGNPVRFVSHWFTIYYEKVQGWDKWGGIFPKFTLNREKGVLDKLCREWSVESYRTEDFWEELKDRCDL